MSLRPHKTWIHPIISENWKPQRHSSIGWWLNKLCLGALLGCRKSKLSTQHRIMVKGMDSGARQPGFKSQLCYILIVQPWAGYPISLGVCCSICKMEGNESYLSCWVVSKIDSIYVKCLERCLAHSRHYLSVCNYTMSCGGEHSDILRYHVEIWWHSHL